MKKWLKAFRLHTLPLSLSGIVVGTGVALSMGYFDGIICVLLFASSIGLQVLSNLANDYGDWIRGTDNESRIGPMRSMQSGLITFTQMKRAIGLNILLIVILLISLLSYAFGREAPLYLFLFILLGFLAVMAAIGYTMGKKPYGYRGWGDLFVLLFFGLCSVLGSFFLYHHTLPLNLFFLSITIGALSVGVLNLNNLA